jgi:outer membrane lipoprotein-sorting protein
MKRRMMLSLLALPLLGAPLRAQAQARSLSAQDRADIARVEKYLNGMKALTARFLQVAPDGTTSEGKAWLVRPGRLRFQYDPPSPVLLVAGHGLMVFYDAQLNQTTNLPLSATPLGLLLQENLRLSGDVTVTGITRLPGQLQVTMVRTATPGDGSLTLIFADDPLALRQWVVVDGQHQETRVSLFDIQFGGSYPDSLFEFVDPRLLPPKPGAPSTAPAPAGG